ncbi:MAG: porphobilinogen synthase [Gammaproteobacteria bacterium]|nr:porphobilinogen synthase [Gammaproteobacteria bacterium]
MMSKDQFQTSGHFPHIRLRRMRANQQMRDLIRETELNLNDLVMPLFIKYGQDRKDPISSMPGLFQFSLDKLANEIRELRSLGVQSVLLFGIPEHKDALASDSYDANGIVQRAIQIVKDVAPEMLVMADVCCCEYTDHGHCGVIEEFRGTKDVHNDKTLEIIAKQAISFAKSGADIIAPSGSIDGQVAAARYGLDSEGFHQLPILSYSIKYASSLYGPFRQAAEGAPKFGDRKTYQMDPANGMEALREVELDLLEGADMLMVKPAQAYLDVIFRVKQKFPHVPLGAYHVSGEFSMIKAAAEKGWIDGNKVALEVLTGIKRAGADFIINYFTKELAKDLG